MRGAGAILAARIIAELKELSELAARAEQGCGSGQRKTTMTIISMAWR